MLRFVHAETICCLAAYRAGDEVIGAVSVGGTLGRHLDEEGATASLAEV
jgi:hypothetical protein